MKHSKRPSESLFDYKYRLFTNRKEYNLEWDEVGDLIREHDSSFKDGGDHLRKKSYGYVEAVEDLIEKRFDKNVMIINDVHLPHERDDVLDIIKKHSLEIDCLVIAGDLMDCESISSFDKLQALPLTDELIYTHNFLTKVRKILGDKKIFLLRGNHEERLRRDISNMQKRQLIPLINPEILEMFVDGFNIYENGKKIKYAPIDNLVYIPHWYFTLDRMIIAHPKSFSKVKGKMTQNVVEYFLNQLLEFDLVVFGHTHKFCFSRVEGQMSKLSLENCTLAKPASYADTGKLGYSPQSYGYCIIRYNEESKITQEGIDIYLLEP